MTYADRIPAPRPIPTTRDRLRPTPHLDAVKAERDDTLDALRDTLAELKDRTVERDEALDARDCAQQTAAFRKGVIDRHRQELGAAGEVLAVVRDAQEQIERALARYDTQPGVTPVEAAGDDQAEEDDLRSPLAAERDQLVETIGRLVSLPPEQIAKMHKVGYSGGQEDQQPPSSVPPRRAQEDPFALPAWVLDLVRGLDRYELEHPQLYRQMGAGVYVEWACPAPLLAFVPAEVRRQAEREG